MFSSARRRVAVSTSKMPPQQPHRLLDFLDKALNFCAHRFVPGSNCSACSVPELAPQPSSAQPSGTTSNPGTMTATMSEATGPHRLRQSLTAKSRRGKNGRLQVDRTCRKQCQRKSGIASKRKAPAFKAGAPDLYCWEDQYRPPVPERTARSASGLTPKPQDLPPPPPPPSATPSPTTE